MRGPGWDRPGMMMVVINKLHCTTVVLGPTSTVERTEVSQKHRERGQAYSNSECPSICTYCLYYFSIIQILWLLGCFQIGYDSKEDNPVL